MTTKEQELAELEQQINAKNAELETGQPPAAASPAPAETVEPAKAEASQTVETPSEPGSQGQPSESEFDPKAWVQKKGWKSAEDAARSMRELEKKLNEQGQELRQLKEGQGYQPPQNPYAPPMNGYQPQAPAYLPPPSWSPPPQSYAPQPYGAPGQRVPSEAEIAATYNMTVDDFRTFLPLVRDAAEVQTRRVREDFDKWRTEITQQNERNSDLTSVISDPAFHNETVQHEMHELLSKEPGLFKNPRHLSIALKEALANIGRQNMTRGTSSGSFVPTEPPKTAGASHANGIGTGRRGPGSRVSNEQFEKLSPADQEKMLKSMNAFKTYDDFI